MDKVIPLSLCLLFFFFEGYSQKDFSGFVYDFEEHAPLEFVQVYNSQDLSVTNEDGRYRFISKEDSVYFYHPGYQKLKTTYKELSDTLYLTKNVIDLDEVVVTNAKTVLQRIRDSLAKNYLLTPHTERFFLRLLLRRNDSIVRLQDMAGILKRKTAVYTGDLELNHKDFEVELQEMRKAGVDKDENNIRFIFPSLFRIFSEFMRINAMGPNFEVIEKPKKETEEIEVTFSLIDQDTLNDSYGNYIINGKDNAIQNFNMTVVQKLPASLKAASELDHTLGLERSVFFNKSNYGHKYYMGIAKEKAIVLVKTEHQAQPTKFQVEILLHITEPLGNQKVKSNVNEHKDIFRLKFPYNETYWETQNQLLLTQEMEHFISGLNKNDSQYSVRSNMK